jgi:hypothetical protein
MRTTINIKHTSGADLAKALRSAAAKIDAASIVPGADVKPTSNVRVQVAEVQENDIRAFLRSQGLPVGSRGVISNEYKALFAQHQKDVRKAKREASAARRAEKAAQAEAVTA